MAAARQKEMKREKRGGGNDDAWNSVAASYR